MPPGHRPRYKREYLFSCDLCGGVYDSSERRTNWTGSTVCVECCDPVPERIAHQRTDNPQKNLVDKPNPPRYGAYDDHIGVNKDDAGN